jgi:hypothetical protein
MRQARLIMAVAILHHLVFWVVAFVSLSICGFKSGCHTLENVGHFLLLPYSLLDASDTEYYWFAYLFTSLFWGACAGFLYLFYARQRSATNIIVPLNIIVPVLAVTIALLGMSAFVGRQEPLEPYDVKPLLLPRSASSLITTELNAQLSCRQRNDLAMKRLQISREICDESRVDCGPRCFRPVAEEWPPDCKVVVQKNVCIPNGPSQRLGD